MLAPTTSVHTRHLSEFRDPSRCPQGMDEGLLFVTRDAMASISDALVSYDGRLMLPSRKSGGLRGVNTDYLCVVDNRQQLADWLADYVTRNPYCMVSAGLVASYPSKTCWLHVESLAAYGRETPLWSLPASDLRRQCKFAIYRECVLGGTVHTASTDVYSLLRYSVQWWLRDRWSKAGGGIIALSGRHDCRDEMLNDYAYNCDIQQYVWYGPRSKKDWIEFDFRHHNKLFRKGE